MPKKRTRQWSNKKKARWARQMLASKREKRAELQLLLQQGQGQSQGQDGDLDRPGEAVGVKVEVAEDEEVVQVKLEREEFLEGEEESSPLPYFQEEYVKEEVEGDDGDGDDIDVKIELPEPEELDLDDVPLIFRCPGIRRSSGPASTLPGRETTGARVQPGTVDKEDPNILGPGDLRWRPSLPSPSFCFVCVANTSSRLKSKVTRSDCVSLMTHMLEFSKENSFYYMDKLKEPDKWIGLCVDCLKLIRDGAKLKEQIAQKELQLKKCQREIVDRIKGTQLSGLYPDKVSPGGWAPTTTEQSIAVHNILRFVENRNYHYQWGQKAAHRRRVAIRRAAKNVKSKKTPSDKQKFRDPVPDYFGSSLQDPPPVQYSHQTPRCVISNLIASLPPAPPPSKAIFLKPRSEAEGRPNNKLSPDQDQPQPAPFLSPPAWNCSSELIQVQPRGRDRDIIDMPIIISTAGASSHGQDFLKWGGGGLHKDPLSLEVDPKPISEPDPKTPPPDELSPPSKMTNEAPQPPYQYQWHSHNQTDPHFKYVNESFQPPPPPPIPSLPSRIENDNIEEPCHVTSSSPASASSALHNDCPTVTMEMDV